MSISAIHAGYTAAMPMHQTRPAAEGTRAEEKAESRAHETSEEDSKVAGTSTANGGVDVYA